jgi:hypothetical protein
MKVYQESDWAVRRWDWFNEGLSVRPLSFCQFWRTVLLYTTIKQLLAPVRAVGRLTRFVPSINLPGPKVPEHVSKRAGSLLRGLGRGLARGLWFLAYPLRLLMPPVGRAAVAGVVTVGEPIERFGQRNKDALGVLLVVFATLAVGSVITVYLVIAFLASLFWTSIVIASVIGGGFALFGFFRSGMPMLILGVLGLLWDAAVAAKHGICPPVEIERQETA